MLQIFKIPRKCGAFCVFFYSGGGGWIMAVIEHDIVAQVYAAKAASEAADALIRQYMGFIRSEAMKMKMKSVSPCLPFMKR